MRPNKIKEWLGKIFSQRKKNGTTTEWTSADHIEKTRMKIIEAVVRSLAPLAGCGDIRNITLWASDAVVHQALASAETLKKLATEFDNAELYELGKCHMQVMRGKPRGDAFTTIKEDMLYVTFGKEEEEAGEQGNEQCTITLTDGSGSMEQDSYTLESSIEELKYHIGRGEKVPHSDRVNDIVIKDDENNTELKNKNMHVSSNQADIITMNGKFYLQAMRGGCSNMGGSATKILRNGKSTKLTDIFTQHRLFDGDVIELGRKLRLEVNITKLTDDNP